MSPMEYLVRRSIPTHPYPPTLTSYHPTRSILIAKLPFDVLSLVNHFTKSPCKPTTLVPSLVPWLPFTNLVSCAPQAMVETVNNLLQPQAQAAWRDLSTGEQLRAATMLLDTVEQGAFVLADNLLKTDIVQENTDNIRE